MGVAHHVEPRLRGHQDADGQHEHEQDATQLYDHQQAVHSYMYQHINTRNPMLLGFPAEE